MEYTLLHKEEENKQKGIIVSIVVHTLLLLICFIPYATKVETPKEISGISIAFGSPDTGNSAASAESQNTEDVTDSKPDAQASNDAKEKTSTAPTQDKRDTQAKTSKQPVEKVTPIVDESIIAAKEAKKEEAKKAAADAQAERERQAAEQKAQEAARKKAEEEAKKAAYDKSKSKFSDLFGSGKGNNNSTGDQGDPDGDPNSDALDNIATGSGRIGGGLSNRAVLFEPEINDRSQVTGRVVIKVCVDSDGNVSEAKFTQRGSTTTDKHLVDLAIKAAKKYKFTKSDIGTQCGNITTDFKVQ